MTGWQIVRNAESFKDYKYWYGGKRQIATKRLADTLRAQNPGTWTEDYYNRALKDIDGKTRVCDCSGLVCACYGIPDIGSYQIREKYPVWNGKPKPGMIAWKKGHVAIIKDYDGHIIEMRSQAYDYQDTRYRKEAGLMTLLYDPNVDYDAGEEVEDVSEIITEEGKSGWHNDGFGWYYRHTEGFGPDTYYHDCFAEINGHKYCFDSEGYICYLFRVKSTDNGGWL